MKYKEIFKPGKIGKVDIKNRMAVTSMATGTVNTDGSPSQVYIDYVTERAKGGLGLFITEFVMVDELYGQTTPHQLRASRLAHIEPWERLARSVHKYGTKLFAQLHHPGRSTQSAFNEGRQVVSSGDQAGTRYPEKPRMLTKDEIKYLVEKFAYGATVLKMAGVDGVELHGAHTYLIHQFMSELVNNRTDEYGGSFENRMRFVKEIVEAIRAAVGPDYPIGVRISGQEYYPGGYDREGGVKIAKYLEEIGVDYINVSSGISESVYTIQEPPTYEQGWKIGDGAAIKKAVNIPVLAVSAIREPEYAEKVLREGAVDFVGNTRGHLADPQWCNKAKAGDDVNIRKCIQCLYCWDEIRFGRSIKCSINPVAAREAELSKPEMNGDGRTVAIIGSGPAGLEAARVLGIRGFKPVLFEKDGELGGALNLANKLLNKYRIDWLIETMIHQAKEAGVDIRLNTEATIENLKALNPYAVIVATGCDPISVDIPKEDGANVYDVMDYLTGKVSFDGKKIAVIGGGTTGCEVAEKLTTEGNTVSVVEMREGVGMDMLYIPQMDFMSRMEELGIEKLTQCKLQKVTGTGVCCYNAESDETFERDFDAVILSLGFKPNNSMTDAVKAEFENVRVVGDAMGVRKLGDAIREGFDAGFTLGATILF